uniref:Family with sequence similarity 163 member B n=1 Tax=Tetraodon nigroviridis TaxID=99883 RepID=H3DNH3_TETNG
MTAGTVVITGGILASVILLLIIAVLCYCRLQYYCCKKEESESEEEEPDFAVTSRLPPVHSNHNIVAATAAASIPNGPALFSTPPMARKLTRSQTFCPSCTHYEPPFYLQPPPPPKPPLHHQPDGLRNGGERIYRSIQQQDLDLPVPVNITNYRKPNLARSLTMRDMFTRSCSISTDV